MDNSKIDEVRRSVQADLDKGLALLKRMNPQWSRNVTRPVRTSSVHDCVLAQVTGKDFYSANLAPYGYVPPKDASTNDERLARQAWAGDHGFAVAEKHQKSEDHGQQRWDLGRIQYVEAVFDTFWRMEANLPR